MPDDAMSRQMNTSLNGRSLRSRVQLEINALLPNITKQKEVLVDLNGIDSQLGFRSVYVRDFAGVAVQLLTDPSINGLDGKNLDFGASNPFELSGSWLVQSIQAAVGKDKLLATACLYVDGARVDSCWKHSYKPVSFTLAQHSRRVRLSKSGAGVLGYACAFDLQFAFGV